MSSFENETPQRLNIDVDQWRREIRMFAESTQTAIEAIIGDLSNSCSTSKAATSGQAPSPLRSAADSASGDRLTDLKEQIAQRLKS